MKNILLAGAGKSSSYLIDYLLKNAKQNWTVTILDIDKASLSEKIKSYPKKAISAIVDITNTSQRKALVQKSDLVVSLLPPHLHQLLAEDCLEFKKNLITSSYLSDEMKKMDEAVKEAGLLFVCEMGLDPGIDHMTTSSIINGIKRTSGTILSFKSYCGGLVAPESDTNPWGYKISWNPRNIVLAGKMGAKWIDHNKEVQVNYKGLFATDKKVKIHNFVPLSYYPNRDSLSYIEKYQLENTKTFFRATLRPQSFMKGWAAVVAMNLTEENDSFETDSLTYAQWIAQKCGIEKQESLVTDVQDKFKLDKKAINLLQWLGLFEHKLIGLNGKLSSAQILQYLLEQKWKLEENDKDMVVMQHEIVYDRRNVQHKLTSTMVVKGENKTYSAMAKTVGLPIAVLAKKIILNQINTSKIAGVKIPTIPELYVPVLKELAKYDIEFEDSYE